MWNIGDNVHFTIWEDVNGHEVENTYTGTVISTFYEPGDPIQGISVKRTFDGKVFGGLDSQCAVPDPLAEILDSDIDWMLDDEEDDEPVIDDSEDQFLDSYWEEMYEFE